jgi:hypothetical protein
MRNALVAMSLTAALSAPAMADEVYVEEVVPDDPVYVESFEIEEPATPPDGIVVGTRVYGWSALRPADCGTFRYWDGDRCIDARFDSPAIDDD